MLGERTYAVPRHVNDFEWHRSERCSSQDPQAEGLGRQAFRFRPRRGDALKMRRVCKRKRRVGSGVVVDLEAVSYSGALTLTADSRDGGQPCEGPSQITGGQHWDPGSKNRGMT